MSGFNNNTAVTTTTAAATSATVTILTEDNIGFLAGAYDYYDFLDDEEEEDTSTNISAPAPPRLSRQTRRHIRSLVRLVGPFTQEQDTKWRYYLRKSP
ncbi:hypothetical protein BGZ97_010095, partial [Linnemannia gamsii]